MNKQNWQNRWRETAKVGVRRGLGRADLSIGRDPYSNRLLRALRHGSIDTVLDIGANVGQFARLLRASGFGGTIISVEPLVDAYVQLERRARRDKKWHTIHSAVGFERGTAQINVSANSYSSSLLTMTREHQDVAPKSRVIGTQEVEVVTVADLVTALGVAPERTLLKVDTQGYEQQVIDGAGPLIDAFAAVQLELSFVELYEGQPLCSDLVADLAAHGLPVWALDVGISDGYGRLLQCDVLFLRSN